MSIGIWQIALIILLVILLFGAGRIPKVMKELAQGIKAFKSGMHDDDTPPKDK